MNNKILNRARGCWMGQLVGDALGSQVEFSDKADIARSHPFGVRNIEDGGFWNTVAGQCTDDSELAKMLAFALIGKGFNENAIINNYVSWYRSGPFDIGSTTRNALSCADKALMNGRDPVGACLLNETMSQSNGALMRCSPIGIFGASFKTQEVADFARRDAALTHGSEICKDVNAVFAVTLAHAIRAGGSRKDIYWYALKWAKRNCSQTVIDVIEDARFVKPENEYMGWVLVALQFAFNALYNSTSFEKSLMEVVGEGGDTDTNGAIAGALLGAAWGYEEIPERWKKVILNCRPEYANPKVMHPRRWEFWPCDCLEIVNDLLLSASHEKTPEKRFDIL